VFTVLAMFLVDKLGRRPLMLIGSIGLSISFIVLAFLLQSHAPVLLLSIVVLSGHQRVLFYSGAGYLGAHFRDIPQ
jgi:MFS family permease